MINRTEEQYELAIKYGMYTEVRDTGMVNIVMSPGQVKTLRNILLDLSSEMPTESQLFLDALFAVLFETCIDLPLNG